MSNEHCEYCVDPNGWSIYPYYGLAPHTHIADFGGTVFMDKSEWPENFKEDQDAPGCGIYTHCLKCGGDNE